MNTSDKFLLHTIDAATLGGSRKAAPSSALFGFLAYIGALIVLALWLDRIF